MARTVEVTIAGTEARMVDRMTIDAVITEATVAITEGMPTHAVALPMRGGAGRQAMLPQHSRV